MISIYERNKVRDSEMRTPAGIKPTSFQEGVVAAKCGGVELDNPHALESGDYKLWLAGFRAVIEKPVKPI